MTDNDKQPWKHPTIWAALAAFQAELPTIEKGKIAHAGKYAYDYADLSDVTGVVLPLLGKHGLAWTTQPYEADGDMFLEYRLVHESGDDSSISGTYPLGKASATAQQMGGMITYARRYALCAVTGVAPGGDDHDAPAPGRPPAPEVELPDDFPERIEALASPEEARALWSEGEAAGWLDASAKAAITARVTDLRAGDA